MCGSAVQYELPGFLLSTCMARTLSSASGDLTSTITRDSCAQYLSGSCTLVQQLWLA